MLIISEALTCFALLVLQAKANNGDGPELLRSAHDGSTSGHAESLAATLTEHQQHLASIQVTKLCLGVMH